MSPSREPRRAILLLQLGGPSTLAEVPAFLFRLFADPEVLRIRSKPLRLGLAGAIALARAPSSRRLYQSIGGGSPIRRWTEAQAAGLQEILAREGRRARVRAAMNCAAPLVEEVVASLAADGLDRVLAFPLYPQYSLTTTKGALDRAREAVRRLAPHARLEELGSWPTHPLFVQAHADSIAREAAKFPDPRPEAIQLLFSAHSIPKRLVDREGDPYPREVEASVAAILARLGEAFPSRLAWQSRLGPVEWLAPATLDAIRELGAQGARQVLVVPIAFVTDHVETLYEVDRLFAEEARRAGIAHFRRTPGLNLDPIFLEALADLARSREAFWGPG